MDKFIGGTAGLAARGGNVGDDEIATFLAKGGKIIHVPMGKTAISEDRRFEFNRAIRNGGRVMSDKSMAEMQAERLERLSLRRAEIVREDTFVGNHQDAQDAMAGSCDAAILADMK